MDGEAGMFIVKRRWLDGWRECHIFNRAAVEQEAIDGLLLSESMPWRGLVPFGAYDQVA